MLLIDTSPDHVTIKKILQENDKFTEKFKQILCRGLTSEEQKLESIIGHYFYPSCVLAMCKQEEHLNVNAVNAFLKMSAVEVINQYKLDEEQRIWEKRCLPLFYLGAIAAALAWIACQLSIAFIVGSVMSGLISVLGLFAFFLAVVCVVAAIILSADLQLTKCYRVFLEPFLGKQEVDVPEEVCNFFHNYRA